MNYTYIKMPILLLLTMMIFIHQAVPLSAQGSVYGYYLGFFTNINNNGRISVLLTTSDSQPVEYSIEALGVGYYHNGTILAGDEVILNLSSSLQVSSNNDQDKGIYLTANSDKIAVIGQNLGSASSDSYFALPNIKLNTTKYVYYGISVPRTDVHSLLYNSSILIVGTENNTILKLITTQSVSTAVGNTVTYVLPGREYSFVINRLQTFYFGSVEDLSGTKIVTNKPVSLFSGHQCANIPWNVAYCSHLIEQIPPTVLWGNVYYTAPLADKRSFTVKVLAANNNTIVNIYCNNTMEPHVINEGEFINRTSELQEYCAIYSNKEVLVVQFSHGGTKDNIYGDPMMTLIPGTNQYLNKFDFSTIRNPLGSGYNHYVNIIVMEQYYQPNMIYLISGGVNRSLVTQQWVPIRVNNSIKVYATQITITEGITQIVHTEASARLMTIAYGFARHDGYGHIGGTSITEGAVVSLNQSQYSVRENSTLSAKISLSRKACEDEIVEVTISDGSANAGVDYAMSTALVFNVTISAGSTSSSFSIDIINDIIQEDNETFNITIRLLPSCLSLSLGTSSSTVAIIDDDVALITFTSSTFSGLESSGVISATITISGGIVSSKDINILITFTEGAATGNDFNSTSQNATIVAGTSSSIVNISVIDDNTFEGDETFNINLFVSSLLGPGITAGENATAIVTIMDTRPTLTAVPINDDVLSGETITFECMPANSDDPDVELFWTYETVIGRGTIKTDNISQSQFLSNSSLLHQLILPIATINDTGNYSCIVSGLRGDRRVSQAISLTVAPACGGLDRLSHGVLWPITRTGETVEMFCSEVNPSFEFGPYATRTCRDDGTWSRVDTSQCIIRPMQESAIVLSSIYVEVESINAINLTTFYKMELNRSYDDSSLISTTTILSDRLYVQTINSVNINRVQNKRQVSTGYSLVAPVVFTVNIMNGINLANNVTETIRNIVTQTMRSIDILPEIDEVIGFNSVDVCECESNSGGLQQSSVIDICIGTLGSPCRCNSSSCECNEGYSGNGSLCARDTDRDTFPDVNLTCDLPTCRADSCPFITGRNGSSCQPLPDSNTTYCPEDTDTEYGIMWPPTSPNINATNNCPNGSGMAVRSCSSSGQWETPGLSNCTSYAYVVLMTLMEQVENGIVPLGRLTSSLAVVTNRTDEGISAYPADLMSANTLLNFSLNAIEENGAILASDEMLAQDITDSFSNILSSNNNAGWMELEETNPGQSQMLLMNSERFGMLLAESLEVGGNRTIISDNIVIVAELVDSNNINNVTFSDPRSNFSTSNSIFIPASFIQQRSRMTDPIPIVNIIYENIENILPIENNQPISQVLSSQVTNTSSTSSDIAVTLTLQYSNIINDSQPVCGFWNFSLNEGRGDWDTEGVRVVSIDINTSTVICNSTHLTSFAVLVDVSGGHNDFSDAERRALSIVSYIGCGISIICLLIAIIILLLYRNTLLKGIHNFIHLNLAIALLLALIVFVSGIETENEVGCTIVAALLHYFFTAVFTWMLCEGIMLYFLLVKVFNTGLGQRKLFYFALGWGIPVPIVAISAGVAHDQYGHEYCWIDYDEGAIWAFVGPMIAVIILNVIFLLLALCSLYKSKKGKLRVEEASQAGVVRTILKATVILLPLLGITWVFGILAVNQESSVFAWIFTILNSLQGFFILFFHVIRNEKIWDKISSCWKSHQGNSTSSRDAKIKKIIQTTSASDPSTLELNLKLDTSNFKESSGFNTESKSFGIEVSAIETINGKPLVTGVDVKQDIDSDTKQEVAVDMKQEDVVTTAAFFMDITIPSSNNETKN